MGYKDTLRDTTDATDTRDMNSAQQSTVDHFRRLARETGATIQTESLDNGVVIITETLSAEWDHEVTQWEVYANGNASIL